MRRSLRILCFALLCTPLFSSAHEPQIVEGERPATVIEEPETSKVYYGKLTGEAHVFYIDAHEPLDFYMTVLVPDLPDAKKDVSAALINPNSPDIPIAVIGGGEAKWEPFSKDTASDKFFQTEEYRAELPAGEYEIRVWSSNNDSAYGLVIGEDEAPVPSKHSALLIATSFGILLILVGGFLVWRRA